MNKLDVFRKGFTTVEPWAFPCHRELTNSAIAVVQDLGGTSVDGSCANKPYFVNILQDRHIKRFPLLIEFALVPEVRIIVMDLLGHYMQLRSVGIFYTPPNHTIEGSQRWHRDGDEKFRQVKFFMNLHHTPPDLGATEYIPKDESLKICNSLMEETVENDRTSRWFEVDKVPDEDMIRHRTTPDKYRTIEGPAGNGVFLNSGECFHRGGRTRNKARFMFVAQFVCSVDRGGQRASNQPGRPIGNFDVNKHRYKHSEQLRVMGFPEWRRAKGGPDHPDPAKYEVLEGVLEGVHEDGH